LESEEYFPRERHRFAGRWKEEGLTGGKTFLSWRFDEGQKKEEMALDWLFI
jgi:hypothetical protein